MINLDQYISIKKARETRGWYCWHGVPIPNHPLVGKPIVKNGETYIIDKVGVHWYDGWFLLYLLINHNGSHGMIYTDKWKHIFKNEAEIIEQALSKDSTTEIVFPPQ